ncbi:MAG: NAD(P)/FAD-dependent oxidoreductase [Fusobacteriaceae bacterium]
MYDVLIIGAGISGASIARELSRYDLNVAVLDKENDISNGTTKANSAIVHAGYDPLPNTLMAKYNAIGNSMYPKICEELGVPFKNCGSLVLAFDEEDMKHVKNLYEQGIKNKIPQLEILDKKKVYELEPNLQDGVVGALYAKTAGIVGPWELTIAMMEDAIINGVKLLLNNEVIGIKKSGDNFEVEIKNSNKDENLTEKFMTRKIINCAGIYADKIHDMIAAKTFEIHPRKGQYFVLDKSQGEKVGRTIFKCPTEMGKGVLISPTVHGNLLVGPDSLDVKDKEELSTSSDRLNFIREASVHSVKNIEFRESIRTFSGLRAESDTKDFIVGETKDEKGFFDVAGIKSPGLTAAPAIAKEIADILQEDLKPAKKSNIKKIKQEKHFMELSEKEKSEKIKSDPSYGKIVCRCEMITEGEIKAAIKRPAGATTIDGVKKRCRPGMGRCQGGFCGPRVQEIISHELKIPMEKIFLDKQGSYILTGRTKTTKGGSK